MEFMEDVKSFHAKLLEEDYIGAATLAVQLLSNVPKDDEPVRQAVLKGYIRCLLEQEKFVELKRVIEESKLQTELAPVYSYAMYRTEDYTKIVSLADASSQSVFQRHLVAQTLYHLDKSDDALRLYDELLRQGGHDNDEDDVREQMVVNLAAALLSQSIPYVRNPHQCESIVTDYIQRTNPCPVEVLFNYATLQLVEGESSALQYLLTALEHATEPSMRNEILHILNWSQSYLSGTLSSTSSTSKSSTARLLFPVEQLPTQKLTYWQSRLEQYNTAVAQLHQQNRTECQKTCKHFVLHDTDIWWKSRISVLRAYCEKKAHHELDTLIEFVKGCNESSPNVRDAAVLYLEVHKSELSGVPLDASHLPQSVQSSNGVLLTRVALNSNSLPQLSLLQKADVALNAKDYVQAAQLYEKYGQECSKEEFPIVRARLVTALSFVNPQKALELWKQHPSSGRSHSMSSQFAKLVNGAELEAQELPRFKSASRPYQPQQDSSQSKKSRKAILRRRGKSKQMYLAQLEEKGLYDPDRPTQPDPERWIPMMERSHHRKKKKGNKKGSGSGAQGGFSDKEATKLDVLARYAADGTLLAPTSGAPSTAHLSATTGGRKVGRKKIK